MHDDSLAQALYDAYVEHACGLNYRGDPCPSWDDLPEAIRGHWGAVANELDSRCIHANEAADALQAELDAAEAERDEAMALVGSLRAECDELRARSGPVRRNHGRG